MPELKQIMPFLVPIVGILMGVGIGMLALALDYKKKRRIFELHHQERLLALERGLDVPPLPKEFFESGNRQAKGTGNGRLLAGSLLLLGGVAFGVAMAVNEGFGRAVWAGVPMALGAAFLLTWSVDRRERQEAAAQALSAAPGSAQPPSPQA